MKVYLDAAEIHLCQVMSLQSWDMITSWSQVEISTQVQVHTSVDISTSLKMIGKSYLMHGPLNICSSRDLHKYWTCRILYYYSRFIQVLSPDVWFL